MFELLFLLVILVVLFNWTKEIFFPKKEEKSPEKEFGEALAKYLEKGVKVRKD